MGRKEKEILEINNSIELRFYRHNRLVKPIRRRALTIIFTQNIIKTFIGDFTRISADLRVGFSL